MVYSMVYNYYTGYQDEIETVSVFERQVSVIIKYSLTFYFSRVSVIRGHFLNKILLFERKQLILLSVCSCTQKN